MQTRGRGYPSCSIARAHFSRLRADLNQPAQAANLEELIMVNGLQVFSDEQKTGLPGQNNGGVTEHGQHAILCKKPGPGGGPEE